MADPVVGAVVSGLVKLIFDKLGSPLIQEIGRSYGVKAGLKRLSRTLSAINAVLLDAEEKQTTLHSVRDWLENLKDVAYDIEDVLDLISTQALEKRVHERTLARKVRKQFPQFGLARKLKAICGRLEEISANRSNFNLQERRLHLPPPVDTSGRRDESSFVQESSVFGREEDQDWVVSRLVSSSSQEFLEIPVLPIVGMGGMGKTTLAKLVFNDPRVENFKIKLWASLTNEFDKRIAIEKIIQSATRESSSDLNMQALQEKLHRIISGQTFLLVLDNVWLQGPKEWVDLKEILEVGSKSSRIIVTTREDRVATIAGTMVAYMLNPLSDDECWSVFVKYAFRDRTEKVSPSLLSIGKNIVRKCCGVPLAARTLGSQLWNDRDESYWRVIEESTLWKIEQAPDDILPALKLSFDQLPYYLRPCFSIFSTITTTGIFDKEHVVSYWMALGLTESREMNETIEDIGNRYLNELLSRSFFEMRAPNTYYSQWLIKHKHLSYKAVIKAILDDKFWDKILHIENMDYFQMHDLVRELAIYVAGKETTFVSCDRHDVSMRAKHLVWKEEDLSKREFPCQLLTAKKARLFRFDSENEHHMSTSFLHCLVSNFKCLRILSLATYQFEELPNSIGDLKHLRYLCLAGNTKLKRLPDSISNLVNLQTLDVFGCKKLKLFPRNLHRLLSLRHLSFTSKIESFVETSFHGCTSIQKLTIYYCIHLKSISEEIGTLTTLRVLQIIDCPDLATLPNSIQHLIDLEELSVRGCEKLNLSGWDGLHGLRRLRSLKIRQLPLLVHFPDGLQRASGSLKYLLIARCQNLIALPECLQHCTCLLKLELFSCDKLSTLPRGYQALQSLQELWILDCPMLSARFEKETGEDWNLISHIPIIHIYNN